MDVSDLTKVLLQARRFYRPFDVETRPIRRILHPFAGAISAFGFAIIFVTFICKDVIRESEKDAVSGLETAGRAYDAKVDTDKISERLTRLQLSGTSADAATPSPSKDSEEKIRASGKEWSMREALIAEIQFAEARKYSEGVYWPQLAKLASDVELLRLESSGESQDPFLPLIQDSQKRINTLYESLPKSEELEKIRRDELAKQNLDLDQARSQYFIINAVSEPEERGKLIVVVFLQFEAHVQHQEESFVEFFKNKTDEKRKELKNATIVSFVLYGAGLLIGVLGQLAGIEVKDPD